MMEEVDNIIIHSLRQVGCDVDEDITNLASFDTELIVKATVKCLEIIKPGLNLSPILPANMAARFRMGATLAQNCADLGYRGDIGYQTFLYSVEADLRRVFMFLIEKLPKESDKSISEPLTKAAQLEKSISFAISAQISVPWLPYYCHKKRTKFSSKMKTPFSAVCLEIPFSEDFTEYQNYAAHFKPFILEQIPYNKHLIPSILDLNSRMNYKSSLSTIEKVDWINSKEYVKKMNITENEPYALDKLVSNMDLQDKNNLSIDDKEKYPVTENVENKRAEIQLHNSEKSEENENTIKEPEIDETKADCEKLKLQIEELQTDVKKLTAELNYLIVVEQNEAKALASCEEESKFKIKAYELLENGEENIKKLEEAIEVSKNKLINLATQWEKHRSPLIEKYREERDKHSSKASVSQRKIDELKLLEEKEKELVEECRGKDQQYSQLLAEVQKLPKEVNRSGYTQRILEIINNIRKQKNEIDKVLRDTREIQKEINTLSGRLERSFTVVDEIIFRDARTNETSRKAYKLLATLHSDCSDLVSLVEETGAVIREIRDLEEQIDSESAKNIGANLERITADLKQMRQETAILTAQLQSKNSLSDNY